MNSIARTIIAATCIALCNIACSKMSTQERLGELNQAPAWDGVSRDELDHDLLTAFKEKPFQCRAAAEYTPGETADAEHAFNEFVQYVKRGDAVPDFWANSDARSKREQLLAAAIKSKSWKADYVDAVWTFTLTSDDASRQGAGRKLEGIAARGIPVAAYRYASYLGDMPAEQYRILGEAISRGSPDAMVTVGGNIIVRSKALRTMGKSMLDCALAQGDSDAYESLGTLADMEGRRVDAYRLWEKGANNGCESCVGAISALIRASEGGLSAVPADDVLPKLELIQRHYDGDFLFSKTRLIEFETPLPAAMAVHVGDEALIKILKSNVIPDARLSP